MLDVRGNCIMSCVTQPFVWRGSTRVLHRSLAGSGSIVCLAMRVLRRSFAGSRGSIVCVAARPSRGSCTGPAGPTRVPRAPRGLALRCGLHTALGESIRKRCGPIAWRGSTQVLEEVRERV